MYSSFLFRQKSIQCQVMEVFHWLLQLLPCCCLDLRQNFMHAWRTFSWFSFSWSDQFYRQTHWHPWYWTSLRFALGWSRSKCQDVGGVRKRRQLCFWSGCHFQLPQEKLVGSDLQSSSGRRRRILIFRQKAVGNSLLCTKLLWRIQ